MSDTKYLLCIQFPHAEARARLLPDGRRGTAPEDRGRDATPAQLAHLFCRTEAARIRWVSL